MDPVLLNSILYSAPSSLSVEISPLFLYEEVFTESGTTPTLLETTVTGGSGTITYAWTISSQSGAGTMSIDTPTTADTYIDYSGLYYTGADVSGIIRCTVTDGVGQTAYFNLSVSIVQYGLGGGAIP